MVSGLSSTKKKRKRSPLKGKPSTLSKPALIARAILAAKTRARNRAQAEEIRGEPKKISIVIDESLLKRFEKCRLEVGGDHTTTAGIRRAMQDYIRSYGY
tara:strand:- start:154 stop:453 length:300 start_codon:yes stop_codon:yes gene_type:complete